MRPRVLIHISQNWIRLTRYGGADQRTCMVGFDRPLQDDTWVDGVSALDVQLASAVQQLGCEGADVVALYEGPTFVVDLHQAPVTGSDAIQTASLALRDAAPHGTADDPTAFLILGRDQSGAPRRTHVLGVVDEARHAQAIISLVERAGLRCRAIAPMAATTVSAAIEDAMNEAGSDVVVRLRIEDGMSTLTATHNGHIHLFRMISIGTDRLVEALTRPILRHDQESALSNQEARRLLEEVGVPEFDDVIDESRGLKGADLLPIIQPVLQTLVVEVKQSLRFSLSDDQRSRIQFKVCGAGASIRRLAEVLSHETGAPLAVESDSSVAKAVLRDDAASRAALAEQLGLLPPAALKTRLNRRVHRGLIAGVSIAVALLAADAAWSVWITQSMDRHIASLEATAQRIGATRDRLATAEQDFMMSRRAAARVPQSMPPRAHWGAWLAELSRLTPTAVRLTSVQGAHERESVHVRLQGRADGENPEAARRAITHFVDSLRLCPLVEQVELGGIRRGADSAGGQQEFDVTVQLVAAPVTPPPAEEQLP